jgi:hypothetical protein
VKGSLLCAALEREVYDFTSEETADSEQVRASRAVARCVWVWPLRPWLLAGPGACVDHQAGDARQGQAEDWREEGREAGKRWAQPRRLPTRTKIDSLR